MSERRLAREAEGPAECVIDESEPAIPVAAEDDVALVIEQIAIARFALAHLPLQILQGLEALIETLGQAGKALVAGFFRPRREQHHDDGDADQQRQQRDAVPMSEERDENESDGEKSERRPQADAGQPVVAEIAESVRELGAHARRALRRMRRARGAAWRAPLAARTPLDALALRRSLPAASLLAIKQRMFEKALSRPANRGGLREKSLIFSDLLAQRLRPRPAPGASVSPR